MSSIKDSIHVYSLEAGECAYPNESLDSSYACYIQKGSIRSIFKRNTGESIGITKLPRGYILGVYDALIGNADPCYIASENCECIYINIKEFMVIASQLGQTVSFNESRIPLQLFWLNLYELNCKYEKLVLTTRPACQRSDKERLGK